MWQNFLHETITEGCKTLAMDYAAENGDLKMLKWLHKNRKECCGPNALFYSAQNSPLEIAMQKYYKRIRLWCFSGACYFGHLDLVKFIFTNKRECRTWKVVNKSKFKAKFGCHHDVLERLEQLEYYGWKQECEVATSNLDFRMEEDHEGIAKIF